MAKIKRRRLKWVASNSSQVVGYKLYWSENSELNYDSQWVMLGNVTEIVLPDDVKKIVAPVMNHRLIVRPESRLRKVTAEKRLRKW